MAEKAASAPSVRARRITENAVRVAQDVAWLVGTAYLAQFGSLILSLVLRRQLGPDGMGYVALVQLAATFAPFLGLGLMQAAEREIAIALGKGSLETAERIDRSAGSFVVVMGCALLAAALPVSIQVGERSVDAWTLQIATVIVLLQQFVIWGTVRLRTRYRFRTYGVISAIGALVVGALTLLGALGGGVAGALAGVLGAYSLQAITFVRLTGVRLGFSVDRFLLWRLVRLAPSFLGVGLLTLLLSSIDQLAVATFLGTSALGLYSTAYLGNVFLMRVPNLIGSVIYPRLQRDLGAHADAQRVWILARRATDVTLLLLPVLIGMLFVGLPIVVRLFLTSFEPAIPAMRLLLVGVTGFAMAVPAVNCLMTLDLQWRAVALTAGFAGGMWFAYFVASQLGVMSIVLAAVVDVVGYAGYGIASQLVAIRSVGSETRSLLGTVATAAIPSTCLLFGSWLSDTLLDQTSLSGMIGGATVQAGLLACGWLGAVLLARRLSPIAVSEAMSLVSTAASPLLWMSKPRRGL